MARRSYVGRPPAPAIPRAPSRMYILEHPFSCEHSSWADRVVSLGGLVSRERREPIHFRLVPKPPPMVSAPRIDCIAPFKAYPLRAGPGPGAAWRATSPASTEITAASRPFLYDLAVSQGLERSLTVHFYTNVVGTLSPERLGKPLRRIGSALLAEIQPERFELEQRKQP